MAFRTGNKIWLGRKHKTETIIKMKKSHLGKYCSSSTRAKISEACKGRFSPMLGKHHNAEAKIKMSIAKLGKSLSPEHRAKIALSNTGRTPTIATIQKIKETRKNFHHSDETKAILSKLSTQLWLNPYYKKQVGLKISIALKGRNNYWSRGKNSKHSEFMKEWIHKNGRPIGFGESGEKSGNWQGGISFEPYSFEFNNQLKELIKQRDNYICQLCNIPECECKVPHPIHHIDYDKKNSLPTNLITLCYQCNPKVNFHRDYWQNILVIKMENIQKEFQLKLKIEKDKANKVELEGELVQSGFKRL